mgnify:CR=1 FL=1
MNAHRQTNYTINPRGRKVRREENAVRLHGDYLNGKREEQKSNAMIPFLLQALLLNLYLASLPPGTLNTTSVLAFRLTDRHKPQERIVAEHFIEVPPETQVPHILKSKAEAAQNKLSCRR